MSSAENTIICLIYQSPEYAEFVYNNAFKYTPELRDGRAKFLFVANDANDAVLDYLAKKNMPYVVNNNRIYTEQELFKMGFAFPEYINRVYSGYNLGIKLADTPAVTLINSDNAFSKDWFTNMRKRLDYNHVVSPTLVQPHDFENPKNKSKCVVMGFGTGISSFDEEGFVEFSESIKYASYSIGNPFMPLMMLKSQVEAAGYYPQGNLHAGHYNHILFTGDHAFINRLESLGIKHITCNDSIVYHFQEGEKYNKL